MRLWHYQLIPILPRQQLLGQHREVCALRGKSWGRKHSTIDYIFRYRWEKLYHYHIQIIEEMEYRKYSPNPIWKNFYYRGKRLPELNKDWNYEIRDNQNYPEHNEVYLIICVKNLNQKIQKAPAGKYEKSEIYKFYAQLQEWEIIL